jgi:calcium-dependent protein kinase
MYHLGGHPNLVQLHEVYEDDESIHLILELCEGLNWFQRLLAKGTYSERHTANSARVLLKALAYCHSLGVVHRDLKPENLLYTDLSATATIKITDFGLGAIVPQVALQGPHSSSASSKHRALLHEPVGSTFYVAPEVRHLDNP